MRINHYIAALKQHLEAKVGKVNNPNHVEIGSKRMPKDEADVQRIVEGLNSWIPDLWSQQQPLVNISNGLLATAEMAENVKSTKDRGKEAKKQFLNASPYQYRAMKPVKNMQHQRNLQEQTNFQFNHQRENLLCHTMTPSRSNW